MLGTQETFCIVIAGLLERDNFDLFLPEFDKSWVIHCLQETCCCSTNLCTWRPNTVYKNRSICRHHLFHGKVDPTFAFEASFDAAHEEYQEAFQQHQQATTAYMAYIHVSLNLSFCKR
jgi:hypothetical protein